MSKSISFMTLINTLLVLGLIIYIIVNRFKAADKLESFIVTVTETILGKQCPDYCAYDGSSYYLVFNNKSFDGVNNPLVLDSETAVIQKCNELGCPGESYINNMIILHRKTNHDDPQEGLERRCAKKIALNSFSIDRCAFDFTYSSPDLVDDIQVPNTDNLSKMEANKLLGLESKIKSMADSENKKKALDNYKMIRQLVDFINQNDESVMVDYDLETCMFEKIGNIFRGQPSNTIPPYLKQQDLGTNENLHKFRKHFETIGVDTNTGKDTETEINRDLDYLDESSMRGFVSHFKESNKVIPDNFINDIFDDDSFSRY
jgi:hypothetical protein